MEVLAQDHFDQPYPHVEVLPDPVRRWLPASAAQSQALDSQADILMLGGAAGSLKTSTMLVDLIAERAFPRVRSYFFRRTYAACFRSAGEPTMGERPMLPPHPTA